MLMASHSANVGSRQGVNPAQVLGPREVRPVVVRVDVLGVAGASCEEDQEGNQNRRPQTGRDSGARPLHRPPHLLSLSYRNSNRSPVNSVAPTRERDRTMKSGPLWDSPRLYFARARHDERRADEQAVSE